MKTDIFQKFLQIIQEKTAGFILLLDPDRLPANKIESVIIKAIENGVDLFLVGGTLLLSRHFDNYVKRIKSSAKDIPVILFPGSVFQVSKHADAILYLSVISSRNPAYLIENQVLAASHVWQLQIEPISCGYMLIESGHMTSAEFMSNSKPIPRNKPEIALAHALAAQYLGFQVIYLEAGSGAQLSVPEEIITAIHKTISIPILVGGGIRTPDEARSKVKAGASFVVIGNHFENITNFSKMKEFADAIHISQ